MTEEQVNLSEREREILRLVATGASNKEIAQKLYISPNTVKVHLRNIFSKIGVVSRTEATLYALRHGIVATPLPERGNQGEIEAETQDRTSHLEVRPETRSHLSIRWEVALLIVLVSIVVLGVMIRTLVSPVPSPSDGGEVTNAQRFLSLTALPTGRSGMAGGRYENWLLVVGGRTAQGVDGAVLVYDLERNAWDSRRSKPSAVEDAEGAVLGERLYIPGGCTPSGQPSNRLEIYDPRQDVWETGPTLLRPVCRYALVAFEGRLFLFGGWDGYEFMSQIWSYDPALKQWKDGGELPESFGHLFAVAINNKILLVGYRNGDTPQLWAYYPNRGAGQDKAWERRGNLPEVFIPVAATSLAGNLYVVGNPPADRGETPPMLWAYTEGSDAWQPVAAIPNPLGEDGLFLSTDTRVHYLGGRIGGVDQALHLAYQAIYTINLPVINR
ncbi:LuxR C-terminal-related transcriptional regulator [uncultured Thermanaerothrix sp.]|uniref:LuxR C-terminal-related transcriptional regulator n=1 Tax=uncultured Thermanaerothrix sp. TaxID=1195149 RepID=UPI0026269281|nr:LuxR C-terminal-related transcriptional regulator [uncultured Thermanaerothrix sp.]